jgi:hypothetical protein
MKQAFKFLLLALSILVFSTAVSASALTQLSVHAVDQDDNSIPGVVITPEWKIGTLQWKYFTTKEKTTLSDGFTDIWLVQENALVQVKYAVKDGYTCDVQSASMVCAADCINLLTVVCTQNTVPEFGTVLALGIAIIGGLTIFVTRRD